ncbi:MAG TPA: serine/threonine-protein kinase [Kofleriaceae bacterium]|nr:serine/threonine-protein kinase [Kofleriaceae bacterium]
MEPESGSGDERLPVGTVVNGSYRITGSLGVGAMGTVYRAEDVERRTPVALKVLHGFLATDKEASARFRREAFVGVRLVHQNCVPVIDFGAMPDGSFFLALELVSGESLGDVLQREGRLPWRRALHIARHVLRGLDHAHREAIVHRDIKPDNIILTRHDGDADFARILDFGIAKLVDAHSHAITRAGMSVGTPSYLSPEQAVGGVIDARCDLYSLSIVVYEMLTGKTPFGDLEPRRRLYAHAAAPVPTFAEVAPGVDVPADVEALVNAGLAKAPAERLATAAEYLEKIEALLQPEPEPTAPPATPVAAPAPRVRRGGGRVARLALALACVVVCLVGAGALAVLRPWRRGAPPAAPVAVAPQDAAPAAPEVTAALDALEHGKTCKARRAAVARLQALDDPRAIPHLEKARIRPVAGKNANACLTAAADAAIARLSAVRAPE